MRFLKLGPYNVIRPPRCAMAYEFSSSFWQDLPELEPICHCRAKIARVEIEVGIRV